MAIPVDAGAIECRPGPVEDGGVCVPRPPAVATCGSDECGGFCGLCTVPGVNRCTDGTCVDNPCDPDPCAVGTCREVDGSCACATGYAGPT